MDAINAGDTAWTVVSAALVFLMCLGLGFFYGGLARSNHTLSLMFLMMVSTCVVSLQWYFWGYSLTYSETTNNSFIGNLRHIVARHVGREPHSNAPTIPSSTYFIYQCMFAVITPALAFGSTAERMKIGPVIIFLFIWSTLVYNICAMWVWNPVGWLAKLGVQDYAGGTTVHLSSGAAAGAYALLIGERKDYNKQSHFAPNNVAFVFLGTAMLWFGWFGFNGGSALAANARGMNAVVVTHIAGCVGGLVWVLIDFYKTKKWSLVGICTGSVAGLATITPAAGFVTPSTSLAFGFFGALICHFCVANKNRLFPFDDCLDVFAVHYVSGIVGTLMTGICSQQSVIALSYPEGAQNIPLGGWFDRHWIQVPIQLAAIGAITGWSFVVTYLILWIMEKSGLRLRLRDDEELMGTDLAVLGETAYGFMNTHQIGTHNNQLVARIKSVARRRSNATNSADSHNIPIIPDGSVGNMTTIAEDEAVPTVPGTIRVHNSAVLEAQEAALSEPTT